MARQSINAGFFHVNPIPSASRVGPLLASSVIAGRDPDGKTLPEDPGAQFENCFHYIGEILSAAGGDWRHVARITFYVPDIKFRDACNPVWLKYFPDEDSRPARHTQIASGSTVTCEFLAYIED